MMFLSRRIAARTEIYREKYKYVYVALKLMIIYFTILIYFLILNLIFEVLFLTSKYIHILIPKF